MLKDYSDLKRPFFLLEWSDFTQGELSRPTGIRTTSPQLCTHRRARLRSRIHTCLNINEVSQLSGFSSPTFRFCIVLKLVTCKARNNEKCCWWCPKGRNNHKGTTSFYRILSIPEGVVHMPVSVGWRDTASGCFISQSCQTAPIPTHRGGRNVRG